MEEDTSQREERLKGQGKAPKLLQLISVCVWRRPWPACTEEKKVTCYHLMIQVEDSQTSRSRVRIRVYHHGRTAVCFLGSYLFITPDSQYSFTKQYELFYHIYECSYSVRLLARMFEELLKDGTLLIQHSIAIDSQH